MYAELFYSLVAAVIVAFIWLASNQDMLSDVAGGTPANAFAILISITGFVFITVLQPL